MPQHSKDDQKKSRRTSGEQPAPQDADGLSEPYPDTRKWTEAQKTQFIEQNKPLIRSMVSSIQNIQDPAISKEDLLQEASLAFWMAFDTYNPAMKTLITTYAHKCMKNAINEKLRATTASKRKPQGTVVPYDSTISESGEDVLGGDNQIILPTPLRSQPLHVEQQCLQNEVIQLVFRLLKQLFTKDERHVFLTLAQHNSTQVELAKELGCSQAKVSMMYRFVRIRLVHELRQAGYENVIDDITN